MASFRPQVRANVIDIQRDRPQTGDRFLVDTNVWYWLTYSRSKDTTNPPRDYQITQYPNYINKAIRAKSQIFWSALSVAELTTLIERNEYKIFWEKTNRDPANFSIKEYRHGYPEQRANKVIPEIELSWDQVEAAGNCLESLVNQSTVTQVISDLRIQSIDGYDSLIIHAMNTAKIDKIITDDFDFAPVPGITVFTANKRSLSAARSQKKLLTR
jgi:predicted nucleic acid-binding protein